MKTAILQIEPYDDIASIRDKVLWCRSQRILLVLPKQKRAFPGRLDLNLIARCAKENGASIALVTRSDITRDYAQSLAIPVFRSIPEAQRGDWPTEAQFLEPSTRFRGKAAVTMMREGIPVLPGAKPLRPSLRMSLLVVSLFTLIALALFLIPSATIILYPQPETQKLSLEVRASPEYGQVNITGLLPAREERVIVTGQKTLTSSGTVTIGKDKARGEVTIRNLTTVEITIPRGTIVATGGQNSQRFYLINDVTLPVGDEGTEVQVEAVMPGIEGNIVAGTVTLLEGNNGSKVNVINRNSFEGGTSASANSPTVSDYSRARTQLIEELKEMALGTAEKSNSDASSPINDSLKLSEIISEKRENPVGVPSDNLTLNMQVEFLMLVYDPSQLDHLVEEVMNVSIPAGYHDAEGATRIQEQDNVSINADGGASWKVEASRQIIKDLPNNEILYKLRGVKKSEAIKTLNAEITHIKSAEVVPFVKWWPRIPLFTARIHLEERSIDGR